jgi:hypothetical protein
VTTVKRRVSTADIQGGHFAALEQPELLWEDLQEFLKVAWKV